MYSHQVHFQKAQTKVPCPKPFPLDSQMRGRWEKKAKSTSFIEGAITLQEASIWYKLL